MNDFDRDNGWQRGVRDRRLAPQFYGKYVMGGRFVFMDKGRLADQLQRRFAVDTIVQARNGSAVCIEEKIVRWPGYAYRAYALETHSCTKPGHESEGWMRYGQADLLLYCFHQPNDGLICHLIDFPKLQAWFNQHEESLPTFGPLDTLNASMGRKAPIRTIASAVGTRVFTCKGDDDEAQPELFDRGGRPEVGHARPTW